MPLLGRFLVASLALAATLACAQEISLVRDLDAMSRVTLTKDELGQLMPNAKMGRVTGKGSTQIWTNGSDGTFVISSDNRDVQGVNTTAQGKWHVSEDGRYCVLIEWKRNPTEEWCRYILKAGNDYYSARSDKTATERVYKLSISR